MYVTIPMYPMDTVHLIHRGTSEHILVRHVADDTDDAADNVRRPETDICKLENR